MLKYIIVMHIVVQIHTSSSTLTEHYISLKMDTFKKIYNLCVLGEQGNTVDFVVGTREQNKKIIWNKGLTQNILRNRGTKPISRKEYEFYHDLSYCK